MRAELPDLCWQKFELIYQYIKGGVSDKCARNYLTRPDICWQKFELMTNLEAEADSQNEGGHTGDEAAKECIEGEGSNQTAVHEL
jgi:hypothetical protein